MNTLSNSELLKWYMQGWTDELDGQASLLSLDDKFANIAYRLGEIHAIVGDDISSIDLLSDEEIIDLIRSAKI